MPEKEKVHCPECGGINTKVVPYDGGYECLDCQTDTHESWFGVARKVEDWILGDGWIGAIDKQIRAL